MSDVTAKRELPYREGTDLANTIDTGFQDLAETLDTKLSGLYGIGAIGEGVENIASLRVTERGAGANMSVDVAAGKAWVRGDTGDYLDELYDYTLAATDNTVITTADATNARIDMIILQMTTPDSFSVDVLAGTPTAGADLDDRLGADTLPDNAILLADVLVGAGVTSITDSVIRDRRRVVRDLSALPPSPAFGSFDDAPLGDAYDSTILMPHPAHGLGTIWGAPDIGSGDVWLEDDLCCCLVWCYRSLRGVNTIRWLYDQSPGIPMTGNYSFAIYDFSGHLLSDTSTKAFSGSAGSTVSASLTLNNDIDTEVGPYVVAYHVDSALTGGHPSSWFYRTNPGVYYDSPATTLLIGCLGTPNFFGAANVSAFPDYLDLTLGGRRAAPGLQVPVVQLSVE